MTEGSQLRHASCVAVGGRGVLIEGPSGAGKSMLALHMMALGASLVADDRVFLQRRGGDVMADAPPGLPAAIEARGIGLLAADLIGPVALHVVVDLAQAETQRLPPHRRFTLLGCAFPLVLGGDADHLAIGLMQYLRRGRFA